MKRTSVILLICLLGLTGCPREFRSPNVQVPDRFTYAAPEDTGRVVVNEKWWTIFGDTLLDRLIDMALLNNRNLETALSRVTQARLEMGVMRSQFLPSFSAGVGAEADYTKTTKIVQEYSIKPAVSWEISLFGALRNTTREARAQMLTTREAYRGVMLSLAAEVADTYFSLKQYQRSLAISEQTFALRRQSTAIIDSMVQHGMSTAVDLEQAQGLTASAQAAIPQYRRAVNQSLVSLGALLGQTPEEFLAHRAWFDNLVSGSETDSLPLYIPVGLPSSLLERRPDVMQSYYAMQAALAKIGVAQAARFPTIALTADGGIISNTVKGLTSSNPGTWSAALQLTQPIFAFGRNKRNVEIAREQYRQAILAYEQNVITAFGDVENALTAITTLREQALRYRDIVRSNESIRSMTRSLYDLGLTDYLNVLDAERTLFSSQIQYSNLLSQLLSSYTDLYKALGGGW